MKILHIDQNHPLLTDRLTQLGFENLLAYDKPKDAVMEEIGQYDGLVIRSRFAIDRAFIDAGHKLKFIARVGAGLENIDTDYAEARGITLIAAPEGNRNAVGEHALAMLLSLLNKLGKADREVRSGQWKREENRGTELDDKTVGIIGYGNTGRAFAKKLRGFYCKVLCHDILPDKSDKYARQAPLEELVDKADIISLHTPLTPLTEHMVDSAFIDKSRKPFWLINTARGKIVDTADLVAALESGKVLGAGLDVLEYEQASFESLDTVPAPLQKLRGMDNVILSPHIAGWTVESNTKLAETIVGKIAERFGG